MRLFQKGTLFALAAVMVALLVSDAQAGLFRRRAKCSSCSQASQGSYAPAPAVQGCQGCSGGCVPQSFPSFVPYQLPQVMPMVGGGCPDGRCPLKK